MRVYVLSKVPRPGQVKTRLEPALGRKRCARLQRRLLAETISTVERADVGPATLAVAGKPSAYLRGLGWPICAQRGPELGHRMHDLCGRHSGPSILIGADCPGMQAADLADAARWLNRGVDCVLGPAMDGGYWLIGLRKPIRDLFRGVAWGSSDVLADTRQRIRRINLNCRELTTRADIDRPEDLARLRLEHPDWLR